MCNPFEAFTGPNSSSQAHAAARANKQQQAAIDYGMQQLNAIYGGGSYPIYAQSSGTYNPSAQYYVNKNGSYVPYVPQGRPGTSLGSGTVAGIGAATGGLGAIAGLFGSSSRPTGKQLMRRGQLYSMTPSQTYSGYTPQFYNRRAQAYEDFALPQLGQQYKQTQNAIQFNLANRGLLNSGVQRREMSDLNLSLGQQKQGIADTAQGQAQQLQSDVENSRQQAISQLYQTANPAQAQQTALAAASRFSAPSAFAPLANGFANLVNQYAMQQQIAGYQAQPGQSYMGYSPYGNSPLLGAIPQNQ